MTLLSLAIKALSTAFIVVAASLVAERTRPFLAAMVLSLPVSTGPAYVVLMLDHDAAFIAEASLASLSATVALVPTVIAYAAVARRGGSLATSWLAMLTAWLAFSLATRLVDWTAPAAIICNLAGFALGILATRRWRHALVAVPPVRRWFDIPLRAMIVMTVVVTVVLVSESIGPGASGIAAMFPASYTSFILIMHRRLGGTVVAAALANGLVMLVGFVGFLAVLHVLAAAGRPWTGLLAGLSIPVAWSALVLVASRLEGLGGRSADDARS
ncbi:hypothetical protein [Phreatobacter sp.]|uniref:hypothetical protein n=1 Tax=Phreatobacter sp. TaxID=1966341 RepID=UPI003F71E882